MSKMKKNGGVGMKKAAAFMMLALLFSFFAINIAAADDIEVRLKTKTGDTRFTIKDSDTVEVMGVDSKGWMYIKPSSTIGGSPTTGAIAVDSTDKKLKWYDGTAWRSVGSTEVDNITLEYFGATLRVKPNSISSTEIGSSNVPSSAQVLSYDSATGRLKWINTTGLGTITGVFPGAGMAGGGTNAEVTLEAKYDNKTIGLSSGSGSLEVKDRGITATKIATGAAVTSIASFGVSASQRLSGEVNVKAGQNVIVSQDAVSNSITITSTGGGGVTGPATWDSVAGTIVSRDAGGGAKAGTFEAKNIIVRNTRPQLSLYSGSTDYIDISSDDETNVFIGSTAGLNNTPVDWDSGKNNTYIGEKAGRDNATGGFNTGVGAQVLYQSTGADNTAVGGWAAQSNNTGSRNTATGAGVLWVNEAGDDNSAFGQHALAATITSSNTAVGKDAGYGNVSGTLNTYLGYGAGYTGSSVNLTNATAVGANTVVTQNNTVILGNGANVGIGTSEPQATLEVIGTVKATTFEGDGRLLTGIVAPGGGSYTPLATYGIHVTATATHGATGSIVGTSDAQTLSSKTLEAGTTTFKDTVSNKTMKFDLSLITAGIPVTIKASTMDGTIALLGDVLPHISNTSTAHGATSESLASKIVMRNTSKGFSAGLGSFEAVRVTGPVTIDGNLRVAGTIEGGSPVKIAGGASILGLTTFDSNVKIGTNGASIDAAAAAFYGTFKGNGSGLTGVIASGGPYATVSEYSGHITATATHGATGNIVGTTNIQTLSSKTLEANTTTFKDTANNKTMKFDLSLITAGIPVTLKASTMDGTIAILGDVLPHISNTSTAHGATSESLASKIVMRNTSKGFSAGLGSFEAVRVTGLATFDLNVKIGTKGASIDAATATFYGTFDGDGSKLRNLPASGIKAAGASGQVQFNDSGTLGASSTLVFKDGEMGIGTFEPGLRLEVDGIEGFPAKSGYVQKGALRLGYPNGNYVLDMGAATNVGGWLQSTNKSSGLNQNYQILLNPNGGNVGIGTLEALYILHVFGNGETDAMIESKTDDAGLYLNYASGFTGGMYLYSGGFIKGGIWGSGDNSLYINTKTDKPIIMQANNAERARISSTGMDVTGTIKADHLKLVSLDLGAGLYNLQLDFEGNAIKSPISSSLRYKENVGTLEADFTKILDVIPKTFTYKQSGIKDFGVIAEELDSLGLKDLVIYNNAGQPDAVKYDKISLFLIKVAKQQQQQIDELKKAIDQIKMQR